MGGSGTCSDCGQLLVFENARPSVVKKGCGDCRGCYKLRREKRRRAAGVPARTLRGTRDSIVGLNGKTRVEYATVYGHWVNIFHPDSETKQRCYADMPFHAAWNPDKGGSFKAGMLDLIADIGERADWAKEHGVPTNLCHCMSLTTQKDSFRGIWLGRRKLCNPENRCAISSPS